MSRLKDRSQGDDGRMSAIPHTCWDRTHGIFFFFFTSRTEKMLLGGLEHEWIICPIILGMS